MRIIVERDVTSHWQAFWVDQPEEISGSASLFGAVAKLLIHSGQERGVVTEDLQMDFHVSGGNHVEFFVKSRESGERSHQA